ncbi:MAG TPA: hypothetical protein VGJ21_05480 [Terracidiphilus sp.]
MRVEIPARHDPAAIANGVLFTLWGGAGLCAVLMNWRLSLGNAIAFLFFACVFSAALGLFAWNFWATTILELDRDSMRIRRHFLGANWSVRSNRLLDVRNLRYIPPTSFKFFGHSGPGQMRFEVDGKTCRFATGLKEAEAMGLIEQMLNIYEFPRDRAAEYIGIRR